MKKSVNFALLALFLSFSLTLFSGCGKKTGGPATVAVLGTLKIGGSPAANTQITLHPIGDGLQIASGTTDAEGRFELYTGQTGTRGAMVGKYKVVLAKAAGSDMSADYMKADDNAGTGGGSGTPKADINFPEKYTQAATSDKEVEISGKTSDLVIEIE